MSKPTCGTCRFWRMKSDDENGVGSGVCHNRTTDAQIRIIGKNMLKAELQSIGLGQSKPIAILELMDFRVREDFGCVNWEGMPQEGNL